MRRALLRKGLRLSAHLLTLAQLALFAGGFWLHRLSFRRAGVNHHLSFMKRTVEKLYLTDAVTTALTAVALGGAFFLFLIGARAFLKRGWGGVATPVVGAALALAFVVELRLPSLEALPAWPVLLGVTALAFVLQVLKLTILQRFRTARAGRRACPTMPRSGARSRFLHLPPGDAGPS
ncbi:hypothetical protein [uncultured Fretibacterium sp.]|uniref:hypothetical protein n=1 Tax=uncultured Fretibacterium sp. TaxID=1678694 RepID=UPI0026261DA2|nr:hypothetical protein [uncultured Fretibacterium sp.]